MEVGGGKNAPAHLFILARPTLRVRPRPLPGEVLSCFGKKGNKKPTKGARRATSAGWVGKIPPFYLLILVHPTLWVLPRPLPGALLSCFGKKVSKEADQRGASSKGAPFGIPRRFPIVPSYRVHLWAYGLSNVRM